ncbi:hypothetical protein OO013_17235 [Mangrovivirga sp. M17]|uniref:DUF4251 domain-containing protein n=1 Tax=Mangrovivirga halotolerans TaxID=2993936 RepID=A0ABT3RWB3_9BACT|nr:hypothetical protein [Mangrovivirga halotolerans]MCX2745629.1 hypothetical protein [Mangrovivirga halotolerans]
MKKLLAIVFITINMIGFAQSDSIFYEQLAFDFYRTKIIKSFQTKKRIKVYKYFHEFQSSNIHFSIGDCLSNSDNNKKDRFHPLKDYRDSQLNYKSNRFKLDLSNLDKQTFKIKKSGRGSYPKLFISAPHIKYKNFSRVYVNIYERHSKYKTIIYHIEFDEFGNIMNWCKSNFELMINH